MCVCASELQFTVNQQPHFYIPSLRSVLKLMHTSSIKCFHSEGLNVSGKPEGYGVKSFPEPQVRGPGGNMNITPVKQSLRPCRRRREFRSHTCRVRHQADTRHEKHTCVEIH